MFSDNGDRITVLFDRAGYRTLSLQALSGRDDLLRPLPGSGQGEGRTADQAGRWVQGSPGRDLAGHPVGGTHRGRASARPGATDQPTHRTAGAVSA
ncbi:hypothetical protein ACFFKE_27730 [Streptomyces mutabilis]|uniref:hypothetical protein n=1 Tax=Streptomyces mutabilis TaxID=67332 RepID=UPI0017847DDF